MNSFKTYLHNFYLNVSALIFWEFQYKMERWYWIQFSIFLYDHIGEEKWLWVFAYPITQN